MIYLPKKQLVWPSDSERLLTSQEVVARYQQGHAGATFEEAEREVLLDSMEEPDGEKICRDFSLEEIGKGKLTLLFKPAQDKWNVWPKPAQETGNCVGTAGANIGIILIGIDAVSGIPDEVTGNIEGFPDISPLAVQQGAVAWEPIYGFRGHSGQGASCDRLIRYVMEIGGIMARQNYPEIDLDLTTMNTKLSINWGRRSTPDSVNKIGKLHQIRQETNITLHESARDIVAAGHPLWVCSGLSFSSNRDERGYSPRTSKGWGHSWVIGGYDDRPQTVSHYGFPLALFMHDWAKWNSGPREIYDTKDPITGTSILIPHGCMWIDARFLEKSHVTAMNSLNSWQAKPLPSYETGIL